jgi:hypothetical protein
MYVSKVLVLTFPPPFFAPFSLLSFLLSVLLVSTHPVAPKLASIVMLAKSMPRVQTVHTAVKTVFVDNIKIKLVKIFVPRALVENILVAWEVKCARIVLQGSTKQVICRTAMAVIHVLLVVSLTETTLQLI